MHRCNSLALVIPAKAGIQFLYAHPRCPAEFILGPRYCADSGAHMTIWVVVPFQAPLWRNQSRSKAQPHRAGTRAAAFYRASSLRSLTVSRPSLDVFTQGTVYFRLVTSTFGYVVRILL